MSFPGVRSFNDVPELSVSASPAAVGRAFAPRTSPALQLASALEGLNSDIGTFGLAFAKKQSEDAAREAKSKAIETGGLALADAVRAGKIDAAQNPYFVQDYNREAAYIRAQQDLATLRTNSQSWAERSDPAAFQKRYVEELGKIGQAYQGDTDTIEGWNAAASPAMQQDFSAVQAEKAAEIEKGRLDAMANLVAESVGKTLSASGGKINAGSVWKGLAPLHDQFISTGGNADQWDKLVLNGVTAQALSSKNSHLLDILKDPGSGTKGPLYNAPGMASDIEQTRYHIQSSIENAHRTAYENYTMGVQMQTISAVNALYDKFGAGIFTGDVNPDDTVKFLQEKGASPFVIMGALNKAQSVVADYGSLAEAKFKSFAHSDAGKNELLHLYQQGQAQGWSRDLELHWGALFMQGNVSEATMRQAVDDSVKVSAAQSSSGKLPMGVRKEMENYVASKDTIDGAVSVLASKMNAALRSKGAPQLAQGDLNQLSNAARATAMDYLAKNPTDYNGAVVAAKNAMARIAKQKLDRVK